MDRQRSRAIFLLFATLFENLSVSWTEVAHAFNIRTWEAEIGRSLRVQGQPGLQELGPGQAPKLQSKPVSKK